MNRHFRGAFTHLLTTNNIRNVGIIEKYLIASKLNV